MRPPKDIDLPSFSIKQISVGSPQQTATLFLPVCERYLIWINEKREESKSLSGDFEEAANGNLHLCKETAQRIKNGIKLLEKDPQVFEAFQLAHRAMLHQFAISAWIKKGRPKDIPPVYDDSHSWFPFQIAFILQCIQSIADPESDERDLVDLLWFPTGGGKTEAYLGLIAFSIFLRRLRRKNCSDKGGGTVSLMRYTLRLLTVDQFYRATLLICSCELIRRDHTSLVNTAPISIGLWVGGEASPNSLKDARYALQQLQRGGKIVNGGSPVKLNDCPWCGHPLSPADYNISKELKGMRITCPDNRCAFHVGLPVWVVDDDVYRERPSLIIGTVDKFARLPWIEKAGNIFGTDGNTEPPELIIQDELHLISGPLGTLVGLYEVAVDMLCRKSNRKGAKIVASTATIRNSSSQVKALFGKDVRQFPPSGIDYHDSFFAKEDRSDPGRLFAGVFTPGTSPTTALVRTFGCLLHGAHKSQMPDNIRDAYWTLMGYFNSLRELGGARTQVEDDVSDYLKFCAERDGDKLDIRNIEAVEELTSRISSSVLDDVRQQLWETLEENDALDVVLATNMISVGLDVPRLGLMAVVGQPKSTSEYIQASSRIGRLHPGLVVTIYNWTRSRDRSHYERFKGYHGRLYSEVEATSVTPFSSRSRDRGLHAVFITLVRNLVKGMKGNTSAQNFDSSDPAVTVLINYIVDRVGEIDALEKEDTLEALRQIISKWENLCTIEDLPYSDLDKIALLKPAEDASHFPKSFSTLNSLRNIDPAAGIFLA